MPSVVGGAGAGLMQASPLRPAESMRKIVDRVDQRGEQVLDLATSQGDQVGWRRLVAAFGGCGDGQESVGEHGGGDPAVPGGPATNLVLVQASQALAGLEDLLHRPAPPSHPHQLGQWHRIGGEAAVEGEFAASAIAADQQPPVAGSSVRSGDVELTQS